MGTRSVIAVQEGDGWRGRYVHWDGYPEGKLADYLAIVARDGLDTARRTLITEHYGWSQIDPGAGTDALPAGENDGRFARVPGYGTAYTTEQGQSSPDDYVTHDGDDCGTEYAYILADDAIVVLDRRWGTPDADDGKMVGAFGMGADADQGYWAIMGRVPYGTEPAAALEMVGVVSEDA